MKKLSLILILLSNSTFAREKRGTVVLVHGFMRSRGCMGAMSLYYRWHGYRVINWVYPSRKKYIKEHGEKLSKTLQKHVTKHPDEKIHFITQSMGALVVRAALNDANCPEQAKKGRLVMMAPPHRGSKIAARLSRSWLARKIFGERSGRELMQREDFNYLGPLPKESRVLIIAGVFGLKGIFGEANDGKVAVSETCPCRPHFLSKVWAGHSYISWWPSSIKQSRQFIESDAASSEGGVSSASELASLSAVTASGCHLFHKHSCSHQNQ